jgi:hypothetical protein
VTFNRSDLVKPLGVPGLRHCWLHFVQHHLALSFTENAMDCQLSGYLLGFAIAHFSEYGDRFVKESECCHQVECCKSPQHSIVISFGVGFNFSTFPLAIISRSGWRSL